MELDNILGSAAHVESNEKNASLGFKPGSIEQYRETIQVLSSDPIMVE
jgi:hypothetical protein